MPSTQPGPGDHVIRHVEPLRVARRRVRNKTPEWVIEFRMRDGHTLHVGLSKGGDPVRLLTLLEKALGGKKAPEEEPWDPERDMP